ncbi:S-methyl-5'-thioadenosine phosphorylase [Patescibacteria group bacterium]
MKEQAKIGIIGGSGFYKFLDGKEVSVSTPYGKPSGKILISEYEGRKIAFLPRHGKEHQYPPHKINYRANLYALKKLGVLQILAPCAVGSLKSKIKPGNFVICDQFINNTKDRKDTFFDGPKGKVAHIAMAEPYCPELRKLAIKACQKLRIPHQKKGAVIIIEGPRFSTKAESLFWSKTADVINMTQYPEAVLARELEMCYANISLVTDYDAGLQGRKDIKAVTLQEVIKIFNKNNEKVKKLILEIIKNMPEEFSCQCGQALKQAII